MALIGKFRTRSGHRFTSPADVLSLDVEAFASGLDETVSRVGFQIFPATGMPNAEEEWSRTLRFPNYSSDSPLPGTGNGMAPIYCYGANLNANEWAPGWIQIIPYIVSSTGHTPRTELDPIWVLNDSDGGDRRGSSKQVWVHAQNGDDNTGNGTEAFPYETLGKAIEESRNDPAGAANDYTKMNAGGSVIKVEGSFTNFTGPNVAWHTDREWLTIEAGPEGCTVTNTLEQAVWCAGVTGFGTNSRLKLVGIDLRTTIALRPAVNAQCSMHGWIDRCVGHNPNWDPAKRWSVLYRQNSQSWLYVDWQQVGNIPGDAFFTCFHVTGNGGLGTNIADHHDCRLSDWTGIAIEVTDGSSGAVNCLFEYQRYTSPDVWGFFDVTGNDEFSCTVPVTNTLRITRTATLYQNGHPTEEVHFERAAELVGSDFRLNLTDFGGGNDGLHEVTAAGPDWIELSVVGATATSPDTNARFETWGTGAIFGSGGTPLPYIQLVHPDIFWLGSITDSIFSNVASRDIRGAQGIFGSSAFKERVVFFNINDGGHALANPIGGSGWRDCVMTHCSLSGPVTFHPNTTDSIIANNEWRSASNLPTNGVDDNLVNANHTELGTPVGLNGSSGPWYRYDPSVDPWSFEPLPQWLSSASWYLAEGYKPVQDYWAWPQSEGPTIGVKVNVSAYDWGPAREGLTGSSSGSSSVADAELHSLTGLTGGSAGGSSASSELNVTTALFSITNSGTIVAPAGLETTLHVELSSSAAGSSSTSSILSVIYDLSGFALGEGETSSVLSTTEVELSGSAAGHAIVDATAPYITRGKPLPRKLMKQRIHNAIIALIKNGTFHPVTSIDAKTGQLTVDTIKTVSPQGVVLKEVKTGYSLAQLYRRSSHASEMSEWVWTALVEFPQEVACEVFEEAVLESGIQIPKLQGVSDQRSLVARLVDSTYDHPPEQSSSDGTLVEFTFEVLTQLLRR